MLYKHKFTMKKQGNFFETAKFLIVLLFTKYCGLLVITDSQKPEYVCTHVFTHSDQWSENKMEGSVYKRSTCIVLRFHPIFNLQISVIVYWPNGVLNLFCTWLEDIRKFCSRWVNIFPHCLWSTSTCLQMSMCLCVRQGITLPHCWE